MALVTIESEQGAFSVLLSPEDSGAVIEHADRICAALCEGELVLMLSEQLRGLRSEIADADLRGGQCYRGNQANLVSMIAVIAIGMTAHRDEASARVRHALRLNEATVTIGLQQSSVTVSVAEPGSDFRAEYSPDCPGFSYVAGHFQ